MTTRFIRRVCTVPFVVCTLIGIPIEAQRGDASQDPVLAPAGVEMGMPLPEAIRQLESRGFVVQPPACRFTRELPGRGRIELTLATTDLDAKNAGPFSLNRLAACTELGERVLVSGLTYKEFLPRASQEVEPKPELARIVERLGSPAWCQPGGEAANPCVWRKPGGDSRVKTLSVSLRPSFGREIVIEGEPLEILPVNAQRKAAMDGIVRKAQALCEGAPAGETFRALTDCACIAKNVGRAYARGEVDRVDSTVVTRYSDNCPAPVEQLRTFFENQCFTVFSRIFPKWSAGGGCRCAGVKGAEMYLSDPQPSSTTIVGIGSSSPAKCGRRVSDAESVVPPEFRGEEGSQTTTAGASAMVEAAGYSRVGETPPAFRPLELWRLDGRPVVHQHYTRLTGVDQTFDYRPQERAVPRFLNLVLLSKEPTLLSTEEEAARVLAGENLAEVPRQKLMQGCEIDYTVAGSCMWAGGDEFGRRKSRQTFLDQYATALGRVGQPLPTGLVYVEQANLGGYDTARGGFPLEVAGRHDGQPLTRFNLSKESLFGYAGMLHGVPEPVVPSPEVWAVPAAKAEEILNRLTTRPGGRTNRGVALAWIYDIVRTETPSAPYAQAKRHVVLEPVELRLYGDSRLTDLLADLPISRPPAPAPPSNHRSIRAVEYVALASARPDWRGFDTGRASGSLVIQSSSPRDGGDDFEVRPLSFESVPGGVLLDPAPLSSPLRETNSRYLNLLWVNGRPDLLHDERAALRLADQNLAGLTISATEWAGRTEFERQRAHAAYTRVGAKKIAALAAQLTLPQDVMIRRAAHLDPYDFDRGGFPIRLAVDGLDRISGFSAKDDFGRDTRRGLLQRPTVGTLVDGAAVWVEWRNSAGPLLWRIAQSDAQEAVERHPAGPNGRRQVFIGTNGRLHALRSDERLNPLFDGELLEVGLYWDRNLSRRADVLPVTAR